MNKKKIKQNNDNLNVTLKGFLIGMIFSVALIGLLLWYLNKNFNQPKPVRNINGSEITSYLGNQDTINLDNNPPTLEHDDRELNNNEIDNITKEISNNTFDRNEIIVNPTENEKKVNKTNNDKLGKFIKDITKNKNTKRNNNTKENKNTKGKEITKLVALQIGSFSNREQADSELAKLILLNIQAKIVKVRIKDKDYYRIISDNLDSNTALSIQKKLAEKNKQSFIFKK